MTITKYNPAYAPVTFSSFVDRFLGDEFFSGKNYSFVPNVDIAEDEHQYEVHASVPGLNKEDFHIDIAEGVLTISGERKLVKEENKKSFKSIETKYGSFSRSFSLPDNVDATKIEAEYTNGILKVSIPKDETKKVKTTVAVK